MESIYKLLEALSFTRTNYYNEPVDVETYNQGVEAYGCLRKSIKELRDLRKFVRIVILKQVRIHWIKGSCLERYNRDIKYNFEDYASDYMLTKREFNLIKKVMEKYGKQSS